MDIFKERFGKLFKAARLKKAISQDKLAEQIGVEPPTISRWENGKDMPEPGRIPMICSALDVTPIYFQEGEREEMILEKANELVAKTIDESNLLRLFREGDNNRKASILAAARAGASTPVKTRLKSR